MSVHMKHSEPLLSEWGYIIHIPFRAQSRRVNVFIVYDIFDSVFTVRKIQISSPHVKDAV